MFADLLDIQGGKAMGKKWKAYPRPVKPRSDDTRRRGNLVDPLTGRTRTREQVVAILREFGHGAPV